MPLYDCMLLFKPTVSKEAVIDLVARIGKHVYRRNGVLTDVKCFGKEVQSGFGKEAQLGSGREVQLGNGREVQLGYGIRKLDGRYYQGQLMQMTMMTPPSFNSELYYLNKEDRLLRWLLIKHREMKFGASFFGEDDAMSDLKSMRSYLFDDEKRIEEDDDDDDDDDDDYDNEQGVDEQSET